jgi:hypothetical protein
MEEDFKESNESIPALLRGIGFKGSKKNSFHQIPRLLSSTQNNQNNHSYSNGINFAISQYSVPGWVDTRWEYRRNISIDYTQVSGGIDFSNFPVLLDIYDSDFRNEAQVDGGDIFFTDPSGQQLDHEIELYDRYYNSTHARLIVWVKIQTLYTNKETKVSLYWGNPISGNQEDPEGVWLDYEGVWHLKESNGSESYIADSTANSYDGTPTGPQFFESGMIGGARNFTGSGNNIISMASSSDLFNGYSSFSFSFWIYPNYASDSEWESSSGGTVLYKYPALSLSRIYRQSYFSAGEGRFQSDINYASAGTKYDAVIINRQQWNYITYAFSGTQLNKYVNGQNVGSNNIGSDSLVSDSSTFLLGGVSSSFKGFLDEFRASSLDKSADWIETEFTNQFDPTSFYLLGTKENAPITDDWSFPLLQYRKNVTIKASKVPIDFTNFPVLVDIYDSDLHDRAQVDGDDIAFSGEDDWVWSDELLTNSGFEAGSLVGWTVSGNWGTGTDPPQGDKNPQAGNYCAYITSNGDSSDYIQQDVDISSYATYIDSGKAISDVSGWMVSAETGSDNSSIRFEYLNSAKDVISTPLETGYPFPNSWKQYSIEGNLIPSSTRYIRVWATCYEPGWDGGSVDSFSVRIGTLQESSSGFKLDHEIEFYDQSFNSTHSRLIAWVRVPYLSSITNTNITMYYGNNAVRSQSNPEGVWNTNYVGVYHLNDNPSTTTFDSTSGSHDGTGKIGMTSDDLITGMIGNAVNFDGSGNDKINIPYDEEFDLQSLTISAWIRVPSSVLASGEYQWLSHHDHRGYGWVGMIISQSLQLRLYTPSYSGLGTSSHGLINDTWSYITYTFDKPTGTINVNDSVVRTSTSMSNDISYSDPTETIAIGGAAESYSNSFGWLGDIDELRISSIARSANWIATEYTNQQDPNSFYRISNEEEYSRWWADATFPSRKDIVIYKEKVSEDLTDFPVLIEIDDSSLKRGKIQDDAADLLFTDSTNTKLHHEVEYFTQNIANGHLIAWVRVPTLYSSEDTIISMYYGRDDLSSQENSINVWDSSYSGVWHLAEDPTSLMIDSTNNVHATSNGNMNSTNKITGQIDGALNFDGVDDSLSIPNLGTNGLSTVTMSIWINPTVIQSGGLMTKSTEGRNNGLIIDTLWSCMIFRMGLDSIIHLTTEYPLTGVWTHVVGTYDGTTAIFYVNGNQVDSSNTSGTISIESWVIGYQQEGSFEGGFDEARISNAARTADWISTEYQNQYNPSSFYSVGSEIIFDAEPPIINDFGVDELGTGIGKFWVEISDDTSDVQSVKVTINETEYAMSSNGTHWIYPLDVEWQGYYEYLITNASDTFDNYILTNSSLKGYTFTFDAQAPDVLQWKYTTSSNTFRANVSDSWGDVDTVIVNVTSHSTALPNPPTQIMSFYQDFGGDVLGYINDTLIMSNGDIEFKIFVNDTSGNSFLSSWHPGVVWINHAPIVENLTLSPSPLYSNETLVLDYDYYDQENHGESGTVIRWYKNGILQYTFYDQTKFDHESIVDTDLFPGDEWNVTVEPKDGELFGEINSSTTVTILNTPPVVQSVTLIPTTAYTTSPLSFTNTTSDHENDGLSYYIEWYRNSQHNASYDNLLTISPDKTTKGESWYCRVRAFDGTDNSSWRSSNPVNIQNSVPQAVNLTLNQYPVYTTDTLVASWDMEDADGDTENKSAVRIYWYKYGEPQPLLNHSVMINPGNTSKYQSWFFKIQVFDGMNYSSVSSISSITINNSLPIADNVTINLSTPVTTDDLIANWDYDDDDIDGEGTPIIKWYTNTSGTWQQQGTGDTLLASATAKDQYWCFGIQVYDNDDYANEVNSSIVKILNTPPEVNTLDITANPTTINDLIASWESIDNDSDSLIFYVQWYLGGTLNATLQTTDNNATLSPGNTTKGQEWSFNVTAYDSEINSTETSLGYNITIQNSIPTVTIPSYNETSPVAEEKGFNITYSFNDADGDLEVVLGKLIVYWYVNWQYNATYMNYTEIDDIYTGTGDVWSYILRVYDGEAYSVNVSSVQGITIGSRSNDSPYAVNRTITPSTPQTHQILTAYYDYVDNDSDPQYGYEIRWYMNGSLQSDYNNLLTIPSSATSEGQQWNFSVKVFDGLEWGIYYNSSLYTILNSPSEVSNLAVTTNPSTTDDLIASWDANDNDTSDSLTFNITWYLNGILNSSWETAVTSATLNAGNTTKNDQWYFTIKAYDGEDYSAIISLDGNVTILNTVPLAGNLTITIAPTTTDNLVTGWDYYDVDNDPRIDATALITWYRNGESVPLLANTKTVNSGNTTKNQVWWYTLQVYDSQNYSLLQESSHIQIQNSAPVNSSVLPLPADPTVKTGLILTESTILSSLIDYDGDDIQFIASIRWYKTSTLQSDLNGSLTVPGSELTKGEVWYYTIQPSDTLDTGSIYTSGNIDILNSEPTIINAYFTEMNVRTIHNLSIEYQATDDDSDAISISEIKWYRSVDDGVSFQHISIYDGNSTLPYSATVKGDYWRFNLTVTDGDIESEWKLPSIPINIKNSKPRIDPFSIVITGGDDTSDSLQITYMWMDDDSNDNETATEITWETADKDIPNDQVTLHYSNTVAGEKWWVTLTPYDDEEYGDQVISKYYGTKITIGNTPPVIDEGDATLQGTYNSSTWYGTSFGTNFDLVVNYTASDIDKDEGVTAYGFFLVGGYLPGAEYQWYRNRSGVVEHVPELDGETTVSYYNTQKDDLWWVQIRPRDLYGDYGVPVNSTQITIGNTDPQILNLLWDRTKYLTDNDLSFTYDFFDYDTDDDEVNITIIWYLNGTHQAEYDNYKIIQSQETLKDQNWSVTCRVFDGESYSIWLSLTNITIRNTPPSAALILLLPLTPNTTENLNATWTFLDIDGDLEQLARIRWYKNNELQSTLDDSKIVVYNTTSKNELWYYTIEVFDGENYSTLITSPTITIFNTAPTLENVSFTQINYDTTLPLEVQWTFNDIDNDAESTILIIRWFKNGVNQSGLDDSKIVPFSFTTKGDVWNYTVKVFDAQNYSIQYFSVSITIENTLPSITDYSYEFDTTHSLVEPDVRDTLTELIFFIEDEQLTISYTFYDPDEPLDSNQSYIFWYYKLNDTSLWIEEPTYRQSTTIPASETSSGEYWRCIITPFDGTDNGQNITFPIIFIESRPVIYNGKVDVTSLNDTEGHYELHLTATDLNNITSVEYLFDDSTIDTQYAQRSSTDNVWFLEFQLSIEDFQSYLGTNLTGYVKAISTIDYGSKTFKIYVMVPFTLEMKDEAPPRVENPYWKFGDELNPTNITFYANIIEYGSEISEVTLYYYFRLFESTESPTGVGATLCQVDDSNWRMVQMTLHNTTGGIPTYSITVPFDHNGSDREIIYLIETLDSAGNSGIAYDIERDDPGRASETLFTFSPPGIDPTLVLVIVGITIFVAIFGSVVYVKFIRKPELIGLDKPLVIEGITKIPEVEVMSALDSHTTGVVISFFDQRHGPIPIIVLPEILKDNFSKLVDLSDRSFSGTGFSDDFTIEIPSSYDFVVAQGLRTSVLSFGYSLERPNARGGQENITCNILIHKEVFPLVNQFQEEIQREVHNIHVIMDKEPSNKNKIRTEVLGLRKFVSSIIISYEDIYGTTELLTPES